MCTVTFLPTHDKFLLASNRDEKHFRSDALEPRIYHFPSGKIMFPKDPDAGGTWIAMHENGNAVVFLNGGFEGHRPNPPYRKSRGLVLLEMISSDDPLDAFADMDLESIEPFTAVAWQKNKLTECVWDGRDKHMTPKDITLPHIWSSSTLYEEPVRSKRKQWFDEWLKQQPRPGLHDVLHFHRFTGDGDSHNDLLMNRDGHVFTVSITGMELDRNSGSMTYLDLKNNREYRQVLAFSNS